MRKLASKGDDAQNRWKAPSHLDSGSSSCECKLQQTSAFPGLHKEPPQARHPQEMGFLATAASAHKQLEGWILTEGLPDLEGSEERARYQLIQFIQVLSSAEKLADAVLLHAEAGWAMLQAWSMGRWSCVHAESKRVLTAVRARATR